MTTTRTAMTALATAGVLVAAGITLAPPASPHVPSIYATCAGVGGSMSHTPDGHSTTITVRVDDVKQSTTFAGDGSFELPVPQDGATHEWRVEIDADHDQYDRFDIGTVGPCGEEPSPTPSPSPSPTPTAAPSPSPSPSPTAEPTPEPSPTPDEPSPSDSSQIRSHIEIRCTSTVRITEVNDGDGWHQQGPPEVIRTFDNVCNRSGTPIVNEEGM